MKCAPWTSITIWHHVPVSLPHYMYMYLCLTPCTSIITSHHVHHSIIISHHVQVSSSHGIYMYPWCSSTKKDLDFRKFAFYSSEHSSYCAPQHQAKMVKSIPAIFVMTAVYYLHLFSSYNSKFNTGYCTGTGIPGRFQFSFKYTWTAMATRPYLLAYFIVQSEKVTLIYVTVFEFECCKV